MPAALRRGIFSRLVRVELGVRNTATPQVSRFSVMFSHEAGDTPLPVQILYQPSFWLRIELRLDDQADAPADPAADVETQSRIREICGQG